MSTAHITSVRIYVTVFAALLVFTLMHRAGGEVRLRLAEHAGGADDRGDQGHRWSSIYFMGVRYNTPLTKVVVVAGFFWLFILFGLGMSDYLTRPWLGVPGR